MKKCTRCGEEKPEIDFPINGKKLRSQCKSCVADRSRLWRIEHPTYATLYMREYIKKNYPEMKKRMEKKKKEISEWKRERGCTVCGETEPWVLDMHHLDPTEKESNSAQSATLKTFLKEAEKCILLCSNCHRKVHAGVMQLTTAHIEKFKYSMRQGLKAGSDDAGKAQHYMEKLAEVTQQVTDSVPPT